MTDTTSWAPVVIPQGPELAALRHDAVFVCDEILLQLSELMQLRDPTRKLCSEERKERALAHAGDVPLDVYGTWFFYPWSKTLVHLLPRAEFRELRTAVNRYKITTAEQDRLSRFTLGIVGLSVGHCTAITLALEGVGGTLRLADFDTLAPSNMNRLRAGVHSLGLNKAVLTAREISELDPYLNVAIYPDGITEENMDAFLEGLDLLFEESDDLRMKVHLREHARARRIPVLMGTSDRGLVDVERFDREPERPLFHGITGPLDEKKLGGMTSYEKIPIAFAIVGPTLSRRAAASFVDVSVVLNTWPQLASAVSLSSAINTDAARRILLGQFTDSGRFFVDLQNIVRNGAAEPIPPPVPDESELPPPAPDPLPPIVRRMPARVRGRVGIAPDDARTLLAHAILAPSGGNCQPWRFVLQRGRILCMHDPARSASGGMLDFEHGATHLAFGALARNVELTAREMGLSVAVVPFPDSNPLLVCTIEPVSSSENPRSELAAFIADRVTNRRLGPRRPLENVHRTELSEAARRTGAHLAWVEQDDALSELADILGEGDRIRCLSPTMHREMMSEIRWTRAEALTRRDGLDVATLELGPTDRVGLRLISDPDVMKVAHEIGAGRGLTLPAKKALAGSSAVGLLSISGTDRGAYFAGGRAMQDVWLTATAHGLGFQPMTALLYMFARLERGGGAGFTPDERTELRRLRQRFHEIAGAREGHAELLLFRLSYVPPPSARSLRQRIDDVLLVTA